MTTASSSQKVPWYDSILVAIIFLALLVIAIPLAILALFTIPYYFIFPDHHKHQWDFTGTPHQRQRLAKWRAKYRELGFPGRLHRAFIRRRTHPIWRIHGSSPSSEH